MMAVSLEDLFIEWEALGSATTLDFVNRDTGFACTRGYLNDNAEIDYLLLLFACTVQRA